MPVTDALYNSLMLDLSCSPSACDDFGIESAEHYAVLQWAVRRGELSRETLDSVLGDGAAINRMVAGVSDRFPGNPYPCVRFRTIWDEARECGMDEDADPAVEDVGGGHAVSCPLHRRFAGDVVGCGSSDLDGPDSGDFYTCRFCGLVFRPERRFKSVTTTVDYTSSPSRQRGVYR